MEQEFTMSMYANKNDLIAALQTRVDEYDREIQEQCRIIGMSAERELRMVTKMGELTKENRYLNDGCAELEAHIQLLEKENASLKQDAERYELLLEMEWFQSNAAFYLNLEDTETIGEFKAACDNRLSYIQSSQERGK